MIIGYGIDLVNFKRFKKMKKKKLQRLAEHILADSELDNFYLSKNKKSLLSKYWVVKEAVYKSLTKDLQNKLSFNDIIILFKKNYSPLVYFSDKLETTINCFISLSHDGNYLIAGCITTN